MQRFRYLTRQGNIVTSTDVDLILREDNCLLVVNRGSMLNPKPVFARREQGIVIEKEQEVELDSLPNLLFEYKYLPIYYIGFTKGFVLKLQKGVREVEANYEESLESEEGLYNDFLRDLKRNREKWLLRQANVDKIRESFEKNLKNNSISYIDEKKEDNLDSIINRIKKNEKNILDINDIIDQEFSSYNQELTIEENSIDELDFIPVKKVKK